MDSCNWRSRALPSPSSSSSSFEDPFTRSRTRLLCRPQIGDFVYLPLKDKVPESSIIHASVSGTPWSHPLVVISINGDNATCLQVTSFEGKSILTRNKGLEWDGRYMPVAQLGATAAETQHDYHPTLSLATASATLKKRSYVNVEDPLTIEWANLDTYENLPSAPTLSQTSLAAVSIIMGLWNTGRRGVAGLSTALDGQLRADLGAQVHAFNGATIGPAVMPTPPRPLSPAKTPSPKSVAARPVDSNWRSTPARPAFVEGPTQRTVCFNAPSALWSRPKAEGMAGNWRAR